MCGPQRPKFWIFAGNFGFWILERHVAYLHVQILERYVAILCVRPPTPKFWIFAGNFGFWILERHVAYLYVQILDFGTKF